MKIVGIKTPKILWIGDRHPLIPHYKKNAIWSPGFAMLVKDKI